MTALRHVMGVACAATLTLCIGVLSDMEVPTTTSDSALVRLAWRATSVQIRHCRKLTPEELEKVPAHMRRTEECSETALPYQLTVQLDSAPPIVLPVHAAGARQDRPMYVFHEWRVRPGPLTLRVRFERGPAPEGATAPVGDTPALLTLDTTLTIGPRRIALVTYDADSTRLHLEGGPTP